MIYFVAKEFFQISSLIRSGKARLSQRGESLSNWRKKLLHRCVEVGIVEENACNTWVFVME